MVLLSCERPWHVVRLSPSAGPSSTPTRPNLRRALDALTTNDAADALIVVITGQASPDGRRLVTLDGDPEYPDESGLLFEWIFARLAHRQVSPLLLIIDVPGIAAELDARELAHRDVPGGGGPVFVVSRARDEVAILSRVLDAFRRAAAAPGETISFERLHETLDVPVNEGFLKLQLHGDARHSLSSSAPWLMDVPGLGHITLPKPAHGKEGELTGTLLPGRLLLGDPIGSGSFGTIYAARQLSLDRPVAVKVLRNELDDIRERRRFVREMRILARLRHPHIVLVHAADLTTDGRMFFAMELLRGGSLEDELRKDRSPWSTEKTLAIFRPVIEGLSAAHAAGVVHADLKPGNIGLRAPYSSAPEAAPPEPVLLDFGVSSLVAHTQHLLGGTPRYMAPEHIFEGLPNGPSADVFAIGILLCEVLSGASARPGRLDAELHLSEAIPEAARWNTLIEACTRRQPTERIPDGTALLARLDALFFTGTESGSAAPSVGARSPLGLIPRDLDADALLERVLFEPVTVLVGPSGCGKSALVQHDLSPRLTAMGVAHQVRTVDANRPERTLARLEGEGPDLVILDQVERILERSAEASALLARIEEGRARGRRFLILLEESRLGRWLALDEELGEVSLYRLGGLSRREAEQALNASLGTDELIDEPTRAGLLDELELLSDGGSIRPIHLRLLTSALRAQPGAEPGARTLPRVEVLLEDHLQRALGQHLDGEEQRAARALLLDLIDGRGHRTARPRALLDLPDRAAAFRVLAHAGILVPTHDGDRWEIAHDALIPQVMSWCEAADLARRGAAETLRFHVHRSTLERYSLLGADELRELARHPGAITDLDARWEVGALGSRTEIPRPSDVWRKSRRDMWRRRATAAAIVGGLLAGLSGGAAAWLEERRAVSADIGRVKVHLSPFDFGKRDALEPVPAPELPELSFRLRKRRPELTMGLGPVSQTHFAVLEGTSPHDRVFEATSGTYTLEIRGRHRVGEPPCNPSFLDIELPGYGETVEPRTLPIPTCRASLADTLEVPGGTFIAGEVGIPEEEIQIPVREVYVGGFRIDRTEMPVRRARLFEAALDAWHTEALRFIDEPSPTPAKPNQGAPDYPVSSLDWSRARDACAYFGGRLPTFLEASKAARGGLCLDGDALPECPRPNPRPRRRYFWGSESATTAATLGWLVWDHERNRARFLQSVDEAPPKLSPYGVQHLAGSLYEWLADDAETERLLIDAPNEPQNRGGLTKLIFGGAISSRYFESFQAGYADRLRAGNQRTSAGLRCLFRAPEFMEES